jgi:hypothetical protein
MVIETAELAYQLNGIPHEVIYRQERNRSYGLTRRIFDRLLKLSEQGKPVTNEFFKDMGL